MLLTLVSATPLVTRTCLVNVLHIFHGWLIKKNLKNIFSMKISSLKMYFLVEIRKTNFISDLLTLAHCSQPPPVHALTPSTLFP